MIKTAENVIKSVKVREIVRFTIFCLGKSLKRCYEWLEKTFISRKEWRTEAKDCGTVSSI